jgi:hypothetical protein
MNQPVLSPCTGVCTINASGHCQGCFRTLDEIGSWLLFTPAYRDHLMESVLPEREESA